jgi:exopolysaccharide production protein ExoY
MRRQAGAHFAPQYLIDLAERPSSTFSSSPHFNNSYAAARSFERNAEPKRHPVAVIRTGSAVGGVGKRSFDITAACIGLALLVPLFLLIALAVKLADRGPIFYRHRRVGRNGVPFSCLKFRTMMPNADAVLHRHLATNRLAAGEWQACRKLRDDPRITPLGLVLRKTSLDELPQLFNILAGDMSVVGPRPIVSAEIAKYGDAIEHYLRARPGLTGLWQISGRNDVDYTRRVALDRRYVEEWNFGRDLLIILKTSVVVLSSRGCY